MEEKKANKSVNIKRLHFLSRPKSIDITPNEMTLLEEVR